MRPYASIAMNKERTNDKNKNKKDFQNQRSAVGKRTGEWSRLRLSTGSCPTLCPSATYQDTGKECCDIARDRKGIHDWLQCRFIPCLAARRVGNSSSCLHTSAAKDACICQGERGEGGVGVTLWGGGVERRFCSPCLRSSPAMTCDMPGAAALRGYD